MRIAIQSLDKWYGDNHVLRDCSLDVADGELITLLGSSGCGKTTLLRCMAGFETIQAGRMLIGEEDVTRVPPNRRNVGFVFQSYALFPHMTVADNVGYGPKVRRKRKSDGGDARSLKARVDAALELVSLTGYGARYPSELSGGQQQRVALARALVIEPEVLLLDEAFNALDAKLRVAMQIELRKLVKSVGITTICVTHDQMEAMTISDRIAIMDGGRILQIGSPAEIYDRPATPYVADFIGAANLLGRDARGGTVDLAPGVQIASDAEGPVTVVLRPENLLVSPGAGGAWRGRVSFARVLGPTTEYEITPDTGDAPLRAVVARDAEALAAPGDEVSIAIVDPHACVVVPGTPA